ncbi:hypothetical protein SASPL_101170 [Salvia splendens]|uniref:Uncharacterized protein n=1 Tax=Salvia splendens TaxID=180675 RepID=A0A8X8YRF4_SALSN|nr:hypothetical protein SASPL_101170 [Salvia splendens]
MVEPIYDNKDATKFAIQEAALAATKLPVKPTRSADDTMEVETADQNFSSLSGKSSRRRLRLPRRSFMLSQSD